MEERPVARLSSEFFLLLNYPPFVEGGFFLPVVSGEKNRECPSVLDVS